MKNRIVSSLLGCLLAAAAQATTVVGTGTPASCTEAALNAAIGEANAIFGIVTFDCGAAPHTMVLASGKTLMHGVIIDGGGKITLSGGNATRIFNQIQGTTVAIQDITLTRGFDSSGGCILVQGSGAEPAQLSLIRVRFESCRATLFGGAIAATQTTLQIAGSLFLSNQAESGGGGAISLNGGSLLSQADEFNYNRAFDQGGALQLWFASVQILSGDFFGNWSEVSNTPGAGGGGLLLRGGAGLVADTDFTANEAGSKGAGVYLQDGGDLTFEDNRFFSNAAGEGGGIFADATSRAIVRRSTFTVNRSYSNGGAISSSGEIQASASTFGRNFAIDQGSAIYVGNGGSLDLVSATLAENFLEGGLTHAAQLGWIAGATVSVHNTLLQARNFEVPECSGPGGAFSFSLWEDNSCPAASGGGNVVFASVGLRGLGSSCGGAATELTNTYALPPGSFAIDRGSCRPIDPAFDQRGIPRPQGAACDVGAAEFFVPCDGPFFADGFESASTSRWSLTLP